MTKEEFIRKAEEVSDGTGCELYGVYEDGGDQDSFEDDGILHVVVDGYRAAFDVSNNQSLSAEWQDVITKAVMAEFGLPVTRRVLA